MTSRSTRGHRIPGLKLDHWMNCDVHSIKPCTKEISWGQILSSQSCVYLRTLHKVRINITRPLVVGKGVSDGCCDQEIQPTGLFLSIIASVSSSWRPVFYSRSKYLIFSFGAGIRLNGRILPRSEWRYYSLEQARP